KRSRDIAARWRRDILLLELEATGPCAARAGAAAEHLLEDVLKTASATSAKARAAAAALKSLRAVTESLERAVAIGTGRSAGPEALETLETRLALGVDLAAIEGFALLRVANDLVSSVQLGEAASSLGIVLVGVRMMLFGQLAEGAFDLGCARTARHTQHLIGVAHSLYLRLRQISSCYHSS